MIWNKRCFFMVILWAVMLFVGVAPAVAHDTDPLTCTLNGVGSGVFAEYEHEDDNPFKGFVDLTVTNSGEEEWGDFHFYIFDAQGWESSSVFFTNEHAPTSDHALMGYSITNSGHMLNLWFYEDTVSQGESINFQVWTDNTALRRPFFGVGFYASPVPVPGALILFGSGLLGLLGLRRRRADA